MFWLLYFSCGHEWAHYADEYGMSWCHCQSTQHAILLLNWAPLNSFFFNFVVRIQKLFELGAIFFAELKGYLHQAYPLLQFHQFSFPLFLGGCSLLITWCYHVVDSVVHRAFLYIIIFFLPDAVYRFSFWNNSFYKWITLFLVPQLLRLSNFNPLGLFGSRCARQMHARWHPKSDA